MKLKECEKLCEELNKIGGANAVVDKFDGGRFSLDVLFEFVISNKKLVSADEVWFDTDTPDLTSDEVKTMMLERFDSCADEIRERKEELIEKITPENCKYESDAGDPDKWLQSISDRVGLTQYEFEKIDADVKMVLDTKNEFEKVMDDFISKEQMMGKER